MSANGHDKKELNFELDLLPVISMMSVCICFLLLTAVWTNVGSMEINQGLGQESSREDVKSASLWITIRDGGDVTMTMMDSPGTPANQRTKTVRLDASSNHRDIVAYASEFKRFEPELKTALIMAAPQVNYGDVIKVMDRLKNLQINEIGIAPL